GEQPGAGAGPEQALEVLEVEAAQRREEPVAGVEAPAEAPGAAVLLVAPQPFGLDAQRVEPRERVGGRELGLRGLEPLDARDGGARRALERAVGKERDGEAAGEHEEERGGGADERATQQVDARAARSDAH